MNIEKMLNRPINLHNFSNYPLLDEQYEASFGLDIHITNKSKSRAIYVEFQSLLRDHPFSTYAKFSEKLTLLTLRAKWMMP